MTRERKLRVAVVTMCRGDLHFLERWIAYYGSLFGRENLYIYIDGDDQPLPANHHLLNIKVFKHYELSRAQGDKYRIALLNDLSSKLFANGYEAVIGTDSDEFLATDPSLKLSLADLLVQYRARGFKAISALGIDLGQKLPEEEPLDPSKPILAQRSFGVLSSRYTKASVKFTPAIRWGSGFHRIKGHNYRIARGLYLFHAGYCCTTFLQKKGEDNSRIAEGWTKHLRRRGKTIRLVSERRAKEGTKVLTEARCLQQLLRQPQAWNKPLMLSRGVVVRLPARFRTIPF